MQLSDSLLVNEMSVKFIVCCVLVLMKKKMIKTNRGLIYLIDLIFSYSVLFFFFLSEDEDVM